VEGFLIYEEMHGYLKRQCHEISSAGFSHESAYPKPLSIPIVPFQFFRKFMEIFAAQGAPPVSLEKIFNQKSFNILFEDLWEVELTFFSSLL
jgi:hypothetical protein